MAGTPSSTDSAIVLSISRISKRLIGTRFGLQRGADITLYEHEAVLITKLVEPSNLDNLLESRNACISLLTFAGFFRIEVLHIEYNDVIINDGYVAINLYICKTDQLRKGNQVVIAGTPNRVTCLLKIFKCYLPQGERFLVDTDHYFLRALAMTRFSHTLFSVK